MRSRRRQGDRRVRTAAGAARAKGAARRHNAARLAQSIRGHAAGILTSISGRPTTVLATRLAKRDDETVREDPDNERRFYREIIRRAKRERERAAESLRVSQVLRKKQKDRKAAERRRAFRRKP
jgi:hypothetical protein